MLTINEIGEFYLEQSNHFFRRKNYTITIGKRIQYANILISNPSLRVLGIADHYNSIEALRNFNTDVKHSFYQDEQQDITISMEECWRVRFNKTKRVWEINDEIESTEVLYDYILSNQKLILLDMITGSLMIKTSRFSNRMPYENYIGFAKYEEARHIINNNISDDLLLDYPLTSLYARSRNIGLVQAAKEIKVGMDIDISYLAEIDALKVKYYNIIKAEQDIKNLPAIMRDFENENGHFAVFNT